MSKPAWSHVVRLGSVGRSAIDLTLEASHDERARIARLLELAELKGLSAEITVEPWFDGAEIRGDWRADLVQTCGVTLEPLESSPTGHFTVRVVPPDSPHAPSPTAEISVDPDAEDPPDVLESDEIDLAAYVVEHLALEIDPFPRKPGVEFEPPTDNPDLSPFAVLRRLKDTGEA
jgi:uncharacterized metal-binding protein YceD (DUF177 family)